MMRNSLRDEMKDRLRDVLLRKVSHYLTGDEINELVYDLADEVFSVLEVSDQEQDMLYPDTLSLLRPFEAIPWGGQIELRDGDRTIGFLGRSEDGPIPQPLTRVYARLICAAPLLLKACILALDREDVADSELGDLLREVACVALGRKQLPKEPLERVGFIEGGSRKETYHVQNGQQV